jgi:hypothetical protein
MLGHKVEKIASLLSILQISEVVVLGVNRSGISGHMYGCMSSVKVYMYV